MGGPGKGWAPDRVRRVARAMRCRRGWRDHPPECGAARNREGAQARTRRGPAAIGGEEGGMLRRARKLAAANRLRDDTASRRPCDQLQSRGTITAHEYFQLDCGPGLLARLDRGSQVFFFSLSTLSGTMISLRLSKLEMVRGLDMRL